MSYILDIKFSDLNMPSTVNLLSEKILENKKECLHIVTANPEIVMLSKKDDSLLTAVHESFLVTADGIGVVIASKLTKQNISERVTGFDLITNLFQDFNAKKRKINVFLLGASEENVSLAFKNISEMYEYINVVGYHNGFFKNDDSQNIVNTINNLDVDVLLVGLGCPKQELFIYDNKEKLNVNVAVGCGGSIDVFSGNVKRAPKLFQKTGTEWFYRLVKEPKRIKRQITLPLFLIDVLRNK